jgi:hypothetical protein
MLVAASVRSLFIGSASTHLECSQNGWSDFQMRADQEHIPEIAQLLTKYVPSAFFVQPFL